MSQSVIITGLGGQDGSILAEQLLSEGHKVYGIVRRRSDSPNLGCAERLNKFENLEAVEGDITDLSFLSRLCSRVRADRFFHLAAQSHVQTSFKEPIHTSTVTGLATLNCLEAIRLSGIHTRFYNAATSELFGGISSGPCNEESLIYPKSPYGCAKAFGYYITRNYRESYKMFACSGILFNHESCYRGPNFVTRKISLAVARIKLGLQEELFLGNLDAKRDWGYADDFCRGMRLMLDHHTPEDFVLGTGEAHSIREFCEVAFEYAGLGDYEGYVRIDPRFYRPAEVDVLLADYSKAKKILGWEPKVLFSELVIKMVDNDLLIEREKYDN
jgi:GDPmannose 4,6-dehydratase